MQGGWRAHSCWLKRMSCPPSPTPTEFWGEGGIAEQIWNEEQLLLHEADDEEQHKAGGVAPLRSDISPTVPWPHPGAMTSGGGRDETFLPVLPLSDSDSEAEVENLIHEGRYGDEVEIEPDVWERHERHMNRRRTTGEIFGNPAKRQRLQQLTRRRVWKWILDPLLTTRKHIAVNQEDPLFYVLQFINK